PDYVASEAVTKEKVGPIEVTYADATAAGQVPNRPVVPAIDEILAPLLQDKGRYVAAVVEPMAVPEGRGRDYQQRSRDSLEKKYAGAPAQFGKTAVVAYDPAKPVFGPANS
ncbi:DnaT-like ssDNA-binding protein, partial [Mesorhizobium sp. M2D.F.Ca.ET.185.01.1.1]|uniref:DnaT-like ssDNA-binding protein n=1 Tax=Mesorhizobium sp. M2D.F.Ca.ET.185.01.1.1 TaxID=2563938 RepID=UPI001AEEF681